MEFLQKVFMIQQTAKATKDKKNSFGNYNYRSAEGIIEDIKPVLADVGAFILLSDEMREVGGRVYVEATATLYDTESNSSISTKALAREAEVKKGMDEAQITGAASSYARKYALSGLLLLDDNKDADTDEYQARTQNTAKSAPKKANPAPAPAAVAPAAPVQPPQQYLCCVCNKPFTDKKTAEATFKKFKKYACPSCCKKKTEEAKAAKAAAEAQKLKEFAEQNNLPFEIV